MFRGWTLLCLLGPFEDSGQASWGLVPFDERRRVSVGGSAQKWDALAGEFVANDLARVILQGTPVNLILTGTASAVLN